MPICTVIQHATKFVTVIDNKVIGISRHKDYSLFHFKAHDVKALKVPISKFIFVDAKAEVGEVIIADQLKDRGVNYKTAKRDTGELTDVEMAEVSGAVKLARAAVDGGLNPRPEANTRPPVAHIPADGVPKVLITPEAAATDLAELLEKAESTSAAGNGEAGEGESVGDAAAEGALNAAAAVEGPDGEPEGEDRAAAVDSPADDPLAIIKPSRKKRRR